MLITPDLTVFLNPQRKVAYRRMLEADDTSDLDRAFFERRGAFQLIQERYEHHLKRLRRPHFVLDTGKKIDHCIEAIIQQIDSCQQT
jgi:thymidylate kinase